MKKGLIKWDPFRDLSEFQNRLTSFFGDEGGSLANLSDADWQPAVDVAEDEQNYLITADLPEVTRDDAHVMVRDGVLTISGERKRETEEEDKKKRYHRVERSYGKYERSFRVPDNVDPAAITAEFKDGVLKVCLPKSKQPDVQEHRIEVN